MLETPKDENIVNAQNLQVKMSLLPLFAKKIEIDVIKLDDADITLKVDKNGDFDLAQYMPKAEESKTSENVKNAENTTGVEPVELPLGIRLSNKLPDIYVNQFILTITDGVDEYTVSGEKTKISDFIFNKSIKFKGHGKAVLKGKEQFKYDVTVFNKIMPEGDLHDLVFTPQPQEEKPTAQGKVDIIGILKGLYYNNVTANADVNLVLEPENIKGNFDITNVSILNLPPSNAKMSFKGNSIDINSEIYTAKSEVSKIKGVVKTGKNANIDMNFKSNLQLANVLRIVKEIALIFDVKDLQTLTANGSVSADFNVKSDLKTVKSNGYLKVPSANIYYGLYKVGIDNINADVKLNNNNINVNNISFSVFNQPLKLFGTIKEDAACDLHLTANKLNLKGLLIALGQASLMKENAVNSGIISMKVDVTGKPEKINPVANINLENIDIKNIPTNTILKAPSTLVNIVSDGKTFSGTAKSINIKAINPAATVSVPTLGMNIKPEILEITQTPVTIDHIHSNVSGKITNYLTEKIGLDFTTTGDIKSKLVGDMNVNKMTLNLNYATTEASTIIIPMFDKSKLTFTGNLGIFGSMMNPQLKGSFIVPLINIPEIPVVMTNADVKLNGAILNGSATLKEFASGGIKAENLITDFSMKGENFYLNNLKGEAFDGKVKGNIIYNLSNTHTTVDFKGDNLSAVKAIEGATGIKNALTGALGFDTKLTLDVKDYEEMMRSLKGNLTFSVKNGAFGTIGRIDNLIMADNLLTNSLLKNTMASIRSAMGIAEAAKFDYIDGKLSFTNGWANINPIKSTGKLVAYYVTGKYNLLNGYTDINILGRMGGTLVAKMGPVGEISADKLLSYIPKFGATTASIVKAMTSDPKTENTAVIPKLTVEDNGYKDFKIVFRGPVTSPASIKTFKWLAAVDMSAIDVDTVKETIKNIQSSAKTDYQTTVKTVTDTVTQTKESIQQTKEEFKKSAEEVKNLFKGYKDLLKSVPANSETTTPTATTTTTAEQVSEIETNASAE